MHLTGTCATLPQKDLAPTGGHFAQVESGRLMSLFDWLLVAHLMGDLVLQSDQMAERKAKHWPWMLRHVATYLSAVGLVVCVFSANHSVPAALAAGVLLFVGATHAFLDRRGFIGWFMRSTGHSDDHSWLPIVTDQVIHLLILAAAAQTLTWASR